MCNLLGVCKLVPTEYLSTRHACRQNALMFERHVDSIDTSEICAQNTLFSKGTVQTH